MYHEGENKQGGKQGTKMAKLHFKYGAMNILLLFGISKLFLLEVLLPL